MQERIKKHVKENEPFLNSLEEKDRTGKLIKPHKKERVDFSIDEDLFISFRNYCEKNNIIMSGIVEKSIKGFMLKSMERWVKMRWFLWTGCMISWLIMMGDSFYEPEKVTLLWFVSLVVVILYGSTLTIYEINTNKTWMRN